MNPFNLSMDNEEDQMDRSGSIDKSEQDDVQAEQTLSDVKAVESDQIKLKWIEF